MCEYFERTELLLGSEAIQKLQRTNVAVFGAGGVGGYVIEALARCGIGAITVFDRDRVSITNLNRQIIATVETVGRDKVDVVKERISVINPACKVTVHKCFYMPENADLFDLSVYDYVIDAIDTVTAKIELAVRTRKLNIPFISCMGTGNKLDPTKLRIADLSQTKTCPLARVMRRELKNRNILHMKVLFSEEEPVKVNPRFENGKSIPGSIAFVPATAGLLIAAEAIRDILNKNN